VVDDVLKDQGTVVSPGPGAEVFRVVNLSNMFIEVDVPEAHLPNVTAGKSVDVYFPVLDETVKTKVRQTGNFIKPGNRSFRVEIPVPALDGKVKPNMVAKVRINDYTNEAALLIPQSVVSENAAGEQYIYVVQAQEGEKNPTVAKAFIKTGLTQGDYIEVLDGIDKGTEIIIEGARSVRDKQEVKVLTSELTSNE
jgi:RND family efflux transporter MFP subunit